jgi:hypothetical protein
MSYFVIQDKFDEQNVYISDIPKGLLRKYQLLEGISRLDDWPSDLAARFSDNEPEGMKLTDWVSTAFGWLLISGRFKQLLEDSGTFAVEYLPIKMKNHKGRLASADYWIVNFLELVPAVDRDRSVFEVDAAEDDKIFEFERLVLLDEVEARGPVIFRLKEQPVLIMVREDLVARIRSVGFTGLQFTSTADYKSNDPDD